MCLKELIAVAFESSEPLYLLGVLAPSLHRESTDSVILPLFPYFWHCHPYILQHFNGNALVTLLLQHFIVCTLK